MALEKNHYNGISRFYDWLKKIVFGNKLERNEVMFLEDIYDKDILVIGCGSAAFIEYIDSGFNTLTLVDKSSGMLQKAEKQAKKHNLSNKVTIICEDYLRLTLDSKYDIIALPYILDSQKDIKLNMLLKKAQGDLKDNGELIVSDFDEALIYGFWEKAIINLMYVFFRLTTSIERSKTPKYRSIIEANSWVIERELRFGQYGLFSSVWKKN